MACCEPIISNFVNETVSTVHFGNYERSIYGSHPKVDVVYLIGSEWVPGSVFTEVKYNSDTIRVDHGGSSTGYIKVK